MQDNPNAYGYELAIVGGGLAGLTLAIQAADAGYRVIVFEKETYPFHKVCGEYISRESEDFLERCGVPLKDWQLPQIDKLQVSDTRGKVYDFKLPMGGFGISRFQLDNALYNLAISKGVTVLQSCKVTDIIFKTDHFRIQTNTDAYTSLVATACYGKRSNLDVKWERDFITAKPGKMDNFIAVKYHIRYPHNADTIALHNFENGYCGISKIENDMSCLCYLTTAENLRRSANSIQQMEKNTLSQNRVLGDIFSSAVHLYEQPLTISQISFQKKTPVEDHILMLGDAAGMITPLCGNGMSMAMHAGKIAFENIDLFLSGQITRDAFEHQYARQWKEEFAFRTKLGRVVQTFFGGHLSTSLFLQAMHTLPWLSAKVIAQTHGQRF